MTYFPPVEVQKWSKSQQITPDIAHKHWEECETSGSIGIVSERKLCRARSAVVAISARCEDATLRHWAAGSDVLATWYSNEAVSEDYISQAFVVESFAILRRRHEETTNRKREKARRRPAHLIVALPHKYDSGQLHHGAPQKWVRPVLFSCAFRLDVSSSLSLLLRHCASPKPPAMELEVKLRS